MNSALPTGRPKPDQPGSIVRAKEVDEIGPSRVKTVVPGALLVLVGPPAIEDRNGSRWLLLPQLVVEPEVQEIGQRPFGQTKRLRRQVLSLARHIAGGNDTQPEIAAAGLPIGACGDPFGAVKEARCYSCQRTAAHVGVGPSAFRDKD